MWINGKGEGVIGGGGVKRLRLCLSCMLNSLNSRRPGGISSLLSIVTQLNPRQVESIYRENHNWTAVAPRCLSRVH